MNILKAAAGLGLLALVLSSTTGERSGVLAQTEDRLEPFGRVSRWAAQDLIQSWPQSSRTLAEAMLAKYGEPSLAEEDSLLWLNNSPWRRTTVYRTAPYHDSAVPDKNYLRQTISYRVPADRAADLKLFDQRIEVDTADDELSSCSESEAANTLALNLADEIIKGERTVADAQEFYRRTLRLAEAGKSSPYLEGLLKIPAY